MLGECLYQWIFTLGDVVAGFLLCSGEVNPVYVIFLVQVSGKDCCLQQSFGETQGQIYFLILWLRELLVVS